MSTPEHGYEFSDQFTPDDIPVIPAYFKKGTVSNLLPVEVAYVVPEAFTYDVMTHQILLAEGVETHASIEEIDSDQDFIGVMRVIEAGEDGIIADFRHVRPGSIRPEPESIVNNADDPDELDNVRNKIEAGGLKALLAAVFTGPDERIDYMGKKKFQPHIIRLMLEVDALIDAEAAVRIEMDRENAALDAAETGSELQPE